MKVPIAMVVEVILVPLTWPDLIFCMHLMNCSVRNHPFPYIALVHRNLFVLAELPFV